MIRAIILLFTPLMTLFLLLATHFNERYKSRICLVTGSVLGVSLISFLLIAVFNPSLW